jgi:hypothetical protein
LKKLGLDDAIRESRDIYSLIETLDQVDQIIKELPNLVHHWKTIDQQQPVAVGEDQRPYDEIQKFLEDVKTERDQQKSGEYKKQKHLDDLRTKENIKKMWEYIESDETLQQLMGLDDENNSELISIMQSDDSLKFMEYWTEDRRQKLQEYLETSEKEKKFMEDLHPDDKQESRLKDLRTDEKLRKNLEERIQILRANKYNKEKKKFFEEETTKAFYHTELFNLTREEIPDQLRKGKNIDDIKEFFQCNVEELHKKMTSIPRDQRDEYFRNHFFPTVNKTGPHWSDILRVTECEHCDYR